VTDIPLFKVNMSPDAGLAATKVLASGYVGQGPMVDEFERTFTLATGLDRQPLGVNSCSAAIDLALHLIGVGPGDEVITTPITCTATNGPIVNRGASIVWADVDPITGNIAPRSVARMRTERTKAVIAVDWSGRACDYDAIRMVAPGLPVIQDAAHRFYIDQPHGDYVCWSFGPIKHLTCGGYGGALLPPAGQFERARLLRWHGLDRLSQADFRCEQDITEVGYRYHMTDDQAAVGLTNLPLAARSVARARANARWYSQTLAQVSGITVPPFDASADYWLMTILADDREGLRAHLTERGIASSQVHARNDKHTAFRRAMIDSDNLRGVEYFDAHQLSIPVGWWVSDADRERIAAAVIEHSLANVKELAHAS
jgi:dTDP-4-amino-4,6-dideoxygalactose transaminase